ncbi:MAG: hypothetical protein JW702_04245 [Clostridiales bacterium]|nr:hypothetical protein [Clostridiales bacterium]
MSVLYLGYLIFQKKETRFNHLRYFLLLSIVLAVIIPFSTFRIDLNLSSDKYDIKEINQKSTQTIANVDDLTYTQANVKPKNDGHNLNIASLLIIIYFIGISLFSLRISVHLIKILYLFATSKRIEQDKIVLLNNKTGSPFTFISWIFIPSNFEENKYIDILTHERIHASQYHSIDLIMIELLAAVMWFNPLVWMMKNLYSWCMNILQMKEYSIPGLTNSGTKHS